MFANQIDPPARSVSANSQNSVRRVPCDVPSNIESFDCPVVRYLHHYDAIVVVELV